MLLCSVLLLSDDAITSYMVQHQVFRSVRKGDRWAPIGPKNGSSALQCGAQAGNRDDILSDPLMGRLSRNWLSSAGLRLAGRRRF